MPTYAKPVPPLYDDNSATPLQPPPLLGHTELFITARHTTSTLRALSPAGLDAVTSPVKIIIVITSEVPQQPRSRHTTPASEFRSPNSRRHGTTSPSQTPYPRKVDVRWATSALSSRTDDTTGDSLSEVTSDNESALSTTLSNDSKIPKPQGEPGRPGRGGYNLETTLSWNHTAYVKFKKVTHRLIDEHLDTTKCASAQSPVLLKAVRDKASGAFPDLENYSKAWPVSDIIMMRLKYTSSRARQRRAIDIAAGKCNYTCSSVSLYLLFCYFSS
ncbi:hypothetical protein OG21DRAFT_1468594 [Imleria badia]|nr:hypothetical protein OG21DRAFT_1468594 [Imleria badia]